MRFIFRDILTGGILAFVASELVFVVFYVLDWLRVLILPSETVWIPLGKTVSSTWSPDSFVVVFVMMPLMLVAWALTIFVLTRILLLFSVWNHNYKIVLVSIVIVTIFIIFQGFFDSVDNLIVESIVASILASMVGYIAGEKGLKV